MFVVTCPKCKKDDADMEYLCDSPYGSPGTYMAGTERYRCECGYEIYKREGEKIGLKFVFED